MCFQTLLICFLVDKRQPIFVEFMDWIIMNLFKTFGFGNTFLYSN